MIHIKYIVFMSLWPNLVPRAFPLKPFFKGKALGTRLTMTLHYEDFDFTLTSDAKIQPVFLKIQAGRPFLLRRSAK